MTSAKKASWREVKAQVRAERSPEENVAYESRRVLSTMIIGARAMRGMNQTQLAKAIGSSQPKISEYERGEGNPTWDVLARIFRVLELSLGVAPTELDVVGVPRAEYEALLHDREELQRLRKGVQTALLNRADAAQAHGEHVSFVRFPELAVR